MRLPPLSRFGRTGVFQQPVSSTFLKLTSKESYSIVNWTVFAPFHEFGVTKTFAFGVSAFKKSKPLLGDSWNGDVKRFETGPVKKSFDN